MLRFASRACRHGASWGLDALLRYVTSLAPSFGIVHEVMHALRKHEIDREVITNVCEALLARGQWEELASLLGWSLVLGFLDIAEEIARQLFKRREWGIFLEGIAMIFERKGVLYKRLEELPMEERLKLWRLAFRYALKIASEAETRGETLLSTSILLVLLKYHNPLSISWKQWVSLYRKFGHVSDRIEFLEAVGRPRLSHIRAYWQFAPDEYACLVARYVQARKGVTRPLLDAVRHAVEERPELLQAIIEFAKEFPQELLPLINEIVPPQGGACL